MLSRKGFTELRLCEGYVPQYKQMVALAKPLLELIVKEYGTKKAIELFSNPYWFQALATAMGFEHNYTGATTVTIKAIKEALSFNNDLGLYVLGGKGKAAVSIKDEVSLLYNMRTFNDRFYDYVLEISKLSAKADNVLLQDSYMLYFHSIISDGSHVAIINQGMNEKAQLVRRYHWYDPKSYDADEEKTFSKNVALNMKNKESKDLRNAVIDMLHDMAPKKIAEKALVFHKTLANNQKTLMGKGLFDKIKSMPYYLQFPKHLDEKALEVAQQAQNFKELLGVKGVGASTMRGLAYLSALIYGNEPVWEHPQRFCYAFGTKAAKPWYVERASMAQAASILKEIAEGLESKQKTFVLKRLSRVVEQAYN